MNITSTLAGSSTAQSGSGTTASQASTATATSSASPLLAKAEQRVQLDVDTTTAQLSKFGLLKSALAGGQTASQALSKLSTTSTASDATKALGNFFNGFNASIGAANTAAGSSSGSSAAANSAKRVVSDLKSALRADPATSDAMKKLGLTVQSDGSLVQDAKKFAASLTADPSGTRAALAAIGKKVDATAAKELATSGSVGSALSGLNQHSTLLSAQQKALKTLGQSLSSSTTSTSSNTNTNTNTSLLNSGLAAYQSNQYGF
jgi:hypothetical protein